MTTPYEQRRRRYQRQDRIAHGVFVAFWVTIALIIAWAFISFRHVQDRCDAQHGVLVRTAGIDNWGYQCIERGEH